MDLLASSLERIALQLAVVSIHPADSMGRGARYFGTYLYGLSKFENIVFILL